MAGGQKAHFGTEECTGMGNFSFYVYPKSNENLNFTVFTPTAVPFEEEIGRHYNVCTNFFTNGGPVGVNAMCLGDNDSNCNFQFGFQFNCIAFESSRLDKWSLSSTNPPSCNNYVPEIYNGLSSITTLPYVASNGLSNMAWQFSFTSGHTLLDQLLSTLESNSFWEGVGSRGTYQIYPTSLIISDMIFSGNKCALTYTYVTASASDAE